MSASEPVARFIYFLTLDALRKSTLSFTMRGFKYFFGLAIERITPGIHC